MIGTSSWGTIRRAALRRAIAVVVLAGAMAGVVASPAGAAASAASAAPCTLPNKLVIAGLLTEAAARYHAVERAAGGQATPDCVADGLARIQDIRHARAGQISDAVVAHNREIAAARNRWWRQQTLGRRTLPRLPLVFRRPAISRTTSGRMQAAASLGRADLIPHAVAHGISREGGWYGIEIGHVLLRAHYPTPAAAVVVATRDAYPATPVPQALRNLAERRRDAADELRARANSTAAEQQIAAAEAYSEAGLDKESQEAVAKAIELDPTVEVPYEVRSPTGNLPRWNSVRGLLGPVLRSVAELLIAVLTISVLVLLIVRGLRRFRARPVVEPFTGDPKDVGLATLAAVRENCAKLRGDGGHRLKTVASSGESFESIPRELGDVYEPAGTVAALLAMLGRLVPARTRHVTGQVRPCDAQRGAGLTVTFGRHSKVFEEETVWERDFGRPLELADRAPVQPAYDRVALPAAVWLTFASANHTLWRGFTGWIGWPRPFVALGTDEWRSFAHFSIGADLQTTGDRKHAARAYQRALGIDPRNRGAALNLAAIELIDSSDEVREGAVRRLDEVRDAVGDRTADELWFRVRYCTAIGHLDRQTRVDEARRAAVELCAEMLDQRPWGRLRLPHLASWVPRALDRLLRKLDWLLWRVFRWRVPASVEKADRAYLRSVLPSALLFLASALQQDPTRPVGPRPITLKTLRKALGDLRKAPGQSGVGLARFDSAVTHRALVDFVVGELSRKLQLTAEALYNRACYDARVAERAPQSPARWKEVESHLHEAMRRGGPGLASWALEDPTLVKFRSDLTRLVRLSAVAREVRA
jgi:tetratricopeptide (TPR) repeat protein